MDLDHAEGRYLLAGASDASIAVYDTKQPSQPEHDAAAPLPPPPRALRTTRAGVGIGAAEEHRALCCVTRRSHVDGHRFSVSSVAWYPVDNGIFVTGARFAQACRSAERGLRSRPAATVGVGAERKRNGMVVVVCVAPLQAHAHCAFAVPSNRTCCSPTAHVCAAGYDASVKVWDANRLEVACSFRLGSKAHRVAMSPAAASHCLVAVGTDDSKASPSCLPACLPAWLR